MQPLSASTFRNSSNALIFQPLGLLARLMVVGAAVLSAGGAMAQTAAIPGGRVVLVLPFTNRSGDASLNWIGESFPDTLDKRLESAGFLTISHDDRTYAYDHLGLPVDFAPSRATAIRIAQQLDANFIIIGSYNIEKSAGSGKTSTDATTATNFATSRITIQARVLSLGDLVLKSPVEDSAELDRLFDAENAIAWKAARELDPRFNVAEPTFLAAPGAVPLPAFEDYIRGTNNTNPAERLKRLQASVSLVPTYSAALLALGKEQFAQRDYVAAAATLAKVPHNDRLALEANFYLGLARFNSANYAAAAEAFAFVATKLPLPEVVNNQAVALSRQGKDGVALFQRASTADPSDEDYHYNLAVAFYRRGDTQNAQAEVAQAIELKPSDNEAAALKKQLSSVAPSTKMATDANATFTATERVRRSYSETSFRQAAFLMNQMRSARLATLSPAQQAAEYTQQGRDYLAEGLLPEAEGQFQSAISADPNAYEAHAGLAQIRDASGDATQARNQAVLSNQLHSNATAWMVLARLDLAANQFPACAHDVAQALQLDPRNPAALAMKAMLLQRGQWTGQAL